MAVSSEVGEIELENGRGDCPGEGRCCQEVGGPQGSPAEMASRPPPRGPARPLSGPSAAHSRARPRCRSPERPRPPRRGLFTVRGRPAPQPPPLAFQAEAEWPLQSCLQLRRAV